jgi:Tfp pilus assembly major pilin PilA
LLQQIKSIAVGWGSVAGQGHLSWRAELGGAAWTRYLPQSERHHDVRTSGATRFALTVAMPGSADLPRMREAFAADAGPEGVKALQEAEQKLLDASGLTVADWIAPFGPELVSFADDAGEFTAIRLRDAKALARLRGVLVDKLGARYASVEQAGTTIHHLSMSAPTGTDNPPPSPDNAVEARLLTLYQRIGTHLFWIEQDGWMVFAPVPQALMDRLSTGTDRSVQDLLTAAGVAPDALVSVSGQNQHIARTLYHAYLGLALAVGDLGNAPFDIFSVPSAQQLGLPLETSMGVGLSASANHLSLDASYAQHPFEFVSGGGSMAAVAVAGIVAAIAIPAYQDYSMRATVAGALAEASALKVSVAEHNASTGALPDTGTDIEMALPLTSSDGKSELDLDRGAILVTFTDTAAQLAGKHLYLLPSQASGEDLEWRCGFRAANDDHLLVSIDPDLVLSDIEERYLPTECRAE